MRVALRRTRMAGARRLLRTSGALYSDHLPSSSSSCHLPHLTFPRSGRAAGCSRQVRTRAAVSGEYTAVLLPETRQKPTFQEGIGISHLLNLWKLDLKHWRAHVEMLIERGIIGCRSFTLIAVAGSFLGSILSFVEGCFFVLESFYQYFKAISSSMDQGRIIQLLVEAIGMFLVGTAMLTFGVSLYAMFASSDEMKQQGGLQITESRFGLFNLKKLTDSMEMKSMWHAKSRVGHAVLLMLQAGVVDKLKNVQVASGFDLACFAAAVFISSACVFILSKLSIPPHSKNVYA